ncbi:MAG: hypothetical protein RBT38_06355 [Bacteroidales bacterium]|jgi:16S rRNA processing protein RimM|nr:hypothetical protein [Bacteroidales bacterium]
MTYKNQILLGKISRINGPDGSVSVRLEQEFVENIPYMESVFLEIAGKPVPFFISSSVYPGGNILRLSFEGYDSNEKMIEFAGCRIFLTSASGEGEKPEVFNLAGFRVILEDNSLVGEVREIIPNPGHDLLKIISPEKREILMPLHEDFIIDSDITRKTITVRLPEGLIELN